MVRDDREACGRRRGKNELRITNYELRITNYELRITNYELRITNYELRITNYELRITNYELRITYWACGNWEFVIRNSRSGAQYLCPQRVRNKLGLLIREVGVD